MKLLKFTQTVIISAGLLLVCGGVFSGSIFSTPSIMSSSKVSVHETIPSTSEIAREDLKPEKMS